MEVGLYDFLSCREVSRRLAESALDDSALARFLALVHLAYCRHCRRYKRELALLAKAAQRWTQRLMEPGRQTALEERILERLSRG